MTSQGISGNLASWNDGPAATAIREFVARVPAGQKRAQSRERSA